MGTERVVEDSSVDACTGNPRRLIFSNQGVILTVKRTLLLAGVALMGAVLLTSCGNDAPEMGDHSAATGEPVMNGRAGTVVETMNASGYTYIQVDAGGESFWAAAPEFAVEVGDAVVVPEGMPMTNFRSDALDRSFDVIHFVEGVSVNGSGPAGNGMPMMPPGHPNVRAQADAGAENMSFEGIDKPQGGFRIGELYAQKDQLAGKSVAVRGKVVKFSAQIMGTNWIHLQDGTGGAGQNDLTVTSNSVVQVGDVVLVKGTLSADRDFGSGYLYEVIVEGGEVVVE